MKKGTASVLTNHCVVAHFNFGTAQEVQTVVSLTTSSSAAGEEFHAPTTEARDTVTSSQDNNPPPTQLTVEQRIPPQTQHYMQQDGSYNPVVTLAGHPVQQTRSLPCSYLLQSIRAKWLPFNLCSTHLIHRWLPTSSPFLGTLLSSSGLDQDQKLRIPPAVTWTGTPTKGSATPTAA